MLKNNNSNGSIGFLLIILLLFFDYIRPQSILPFLKPLRIPMLLIILISFIGIKNKIWKFNDIATKSFICIIVFCVVYVPFAHNNYWAYQMARALIIYFLCYMGIKSLVNNEKKLTKFMNYWLLIAMFCSVKGIFEGGKITGSGFLGDENDFALYLCMMIPIAYFNLINKEQSKKIFYIIALVVLILGIIKSSSRGGLVGLVGVSFFCLMYTPKKLTILMIGIIVITISIPFLPKEYKDDMATIREGTTESTASERIYSWKCGIRMFMDYPLFGVGPGNFPWRFAEYEPLEKLKGRSHGGRAAHSLYFTVIPEWGTFGIICYFLMIFGPYKCFKKIQNIHKQNSLNKDYIEMINRYELLRNMAFCSLGGYLFAGMFLSVLYYPHFWIICGILVSINESMPRELKSYT